MTSPVPKLVLAAALAISLPVAAAARDCDPDAGKGGHAALPTRSHPGRPPPYRPPAQSWRARELERVRAELHALEAERDAFHARFSRNPGKVRRYDRSYLERRAALERRWSELQWVAWR